MMVGGLGETREKNDEVSEIVERIRPTLEEKSGLKFEAIEVLNFRTQTVAGTNFFIKVGCTGQSLASYIVIVNVLYDCFMSFD